MPNSKEHRLSNINKPNTVGNPQSYMHLDYSNPLVGRMNFRSIVRGSASGSTASTSNTNRFIIRNLNTRTRRFFEDSKGKEEAYYQAKREYEVQEAERVRRSRTKHARFEIASSMAHPFVLKENERLANDLSLNFETDPAYMDLDVDLLEESGAISLGLPFVTISTDDTSPPTIDHSYTYLDVKSNSGAIGKRHLHLKDVSLSFLPEGTTNVIVSVLALSSVFAKPADSNYIHQKIPVAHIEGNRVKQPAPQSTDLSNAALEAPYVLKEDVSNTFVIQFKRELRFVDMRVLEADPDIRDQSFVLLKAVGPPEVVLDQVAFSPSLFSSDKRSLQISTTRLTSKSDSFKVCVWASGRLFTDATIAASMATGGYVEIEVSPQMVDRPLLILEMEYLVGGRWLHAHVMS